MEALRCNRLDSSVSLWEQQRFLLLPCKPPRWQEPQPAWPMANKYPALLRSTEQLKLTTAVANADIMDRKENTEAAPGIADQKGIENTPDTEATADTVAVLASALDSTMGRGSSCLRR